MTSNKIPVNRYKFCIKCGKGLIFKKIDENQVQVCKECDFILWKNPKPVVSILLYEKNKALMLKRANEPFKNYWVLPGGFINYEETPINAIKREAKEETGSDIKISGLVGVYQIDNDPRGIHIDIIYKGILKDSITINEESVEWKLFNPDDLPDKIAYKHREAIIDWANKGSQYD